MPQNVLAVGTRVRLRDRATYTLLDINITSPDGTEGVIIRNDDHECWVDVGNHRWAVCSDQVEEIVNNATIVPQVPDILSVGDLVLLKDGRVPLQHNAIPYPPGTQGIIRNVNESSCGGFYYVYVEDYTNRRRNNNNWYCYKDQVEFMAHGKSGPSTPLPTAATKKSSVKQDMYEALRAVESFAKIQIGRHPAGTPILEKWQKVTDVLARIENEGLEG